MATAADAELVLKLYDLRRESTMRTARAWMMYEFEPETWQDIHMTVGGFGSEEDQFWRQVLGYWEMAASLVLRGALDADLFLDSNTEGFYFLAKFDRFRDDYQKAMGMPFMPSTMELVEKYPAARARFDGLRQHIANRRAGRPI
jgi:hypothetical protein